MTGRVYPLYPHATNMGEGLAAFSNPIARARWGANEAYDVSTSGGVQQQARITFNGDPRAFERTIRILQEMASKYEADPEVIQFTRRLFSKKKLRNHDELGEIQAIVSYFQGTHHNNVSNEEV